MRAPTLVPKAGELPTVGVTAGVRIAGLMALSALAAPLSARAEPPDYAVKAAFLYKLAPFINWPATTFAAPDSPFVICVVGADPFGPVLDTTVGGRRIGAHSVVVRRPEKLEAGSDCNVAYIAGSKAQSVSEALAAVQGTPVLTVTDQLFGEARGIVHFVVLHRRVRFVIDDDAAARNGLAVSSKLMRLAVQVHMRRPGGL